MGSSSKTATRPDLAQQMASNPVDVPFQPTPGGAPPAWNSILPTNGGPAQLGDQWRTEQPNPASATPSAPASTPPNAGAATGAAGNSMPAAVANLSPEARQQYMAAKAAGDDALAARILLAGQMQRGSPVQLGHDRGNGGSSFGGMAGMDRDAAY